jgi:hypothetical protein
MAGLRARVEKMRSGIVEFEVLDEGGNVRAKRFVAFDKQEEKVRCDFVGVIPKQIGVKTLRRKADNGPLVEGRPMEKGAPMERDVKVVHTKTEFLQFVQQQGIPGGLMRLNPGEQSIIADGMPIDVTAVGLCYYTELTGGRTAEKALDFFGRMKRVQVVLDKSIAVLTYDADLPGPARTQLAWWIDTTDDYVPVRYQVRLIPPSGESEVNQEIETSWGRMNQMLVPLRSVCRVWRKGGVITSVEDMRFTWKSVNEKVPDELFTTENLQLPKGTYILDTRLGQPILEEVIGMGRPLPEVPAPREVTWTRMILMSASVAALIAWAVVAAIRRRRRRATAS